MLKVYSWTACPNTTHFIWILSHGGDPEGRAKVAADEMNARPAGERVLFLWKAFDAVDRELDNSEGAIARQIISNKVSFSATPDFYQRFFYTLHKLNAPKIDRIVLDFEGTISVWGNLANMADPEPRLSYMKSLYSDPLVSSRMPKSVKMFKPEDFIGTGNWHGAFEAWNFWVNPILEASVKRAIQKPLMDFLGYVPPITNFGDMHPTFTTYDLNNWKLQDLGFGQESSPALYLSLGGWKNNYAKKHRRWNQFIDNLNYVRATYRACVPWLSHPHYAGDGIDATDPWLWVKMMEHLAEMGISDYLYWNPLTDMDAVAADTFARLTPAKIGKTKFLPIAIDADEVVTGNQKITYAEFLANNRVEDKRI